MTRGRNVRSDEETIVSSMETGIGCEQSSCSSSSIGSSVKKRTLKTTVSFQESRDAGAQSDHKDGEGFLSQRYESLDYEVCENTLYVEELERFERQGRQLEFFSALKRQNFMRWFVIFVIAVLTAVTAVCIDVIIEKISAVKFKLLKHRMDDCYNSHCLYIPLLLWIMSNGFPVLLGSLLVTYWAPVAAGSGIPLIKCYLNGVKVPEVVRFKTFLTKAIGVIASVSGGLACGKEGPMIHCGSVIAAGVSQGKSTSLGRDFGIFRKFREDKEKRDFVSAGAAAGVAAAFGAPVGGVLFSLEEGASFWNQSLTWKIFFCSMMSTFCLNVIMSFYRDKPGELSNPGLLNFGTFEDISYSMIELPVYLVMGAAGGVFGALFNFVNLKLTVFRMKYMRARPVRVLEAVFVAMSTAVVGFFTIIGSTDCRPNSFMMNKTMIQFNCPDGQHSVMAELWFDTPEATVKALFHNEADTWNAVSLSVFFVLYLMIACWTYGLSVSGGIFIPCLLIGAAGGRLIAIGGLHLWNANSAWINPGKLALIGAAAMLGGVVRMTISLTVILIEATGNIAFGLPIMLTLIVSKWVGDYFNEGLYDIHIGLNSVPILPWEPLSYPRNIYASEVMSTPVTTFRTKENVGHIVDVLKRESHNGFPVVDDMQCMGDSIFDSLSSSRCAGRFRGMILRWQLILILQKKIFNTLEEGYEGRTLSLSDFHDAYPRYPDVSEVRVTEQERKLTVDLRPYMNPSPYSVPHTASLPRIFRLFRALGLRHLVVVNDRNGVIGIVSRKDLARYRLSQKNGSVSLSRLEFSER